MDGDASNPSVGQLLGSLVRETGSLVHQEVRLARTELGQKAEAAAISGGTIAMGGALALSGLIGLMAAAIIALSAIIPAWAAALVLGGAFLLVGGMVVLSGLTALKKISPVPEETIESLKSVVSTQARGSDLALPMKRRATKKSLVKENAHEQ